jgi:hypothetical protein
MPFVAIFWRDQMSNATGADPLFEATGDLGALSKPVPLNINISPQSCLSNRFQYILL